MPVENDKTPEIIRQDSQPTLATPATDKKGKTTSGQEVSQNEVSQASQKINATGKSSFSLGRALKSVGKSIGSRFSRGRTREAAQAEVVNQSRAKSDFYGDVTLDQISVASSAEVKIVDIQKRVARLAAKFITNPSRAHRQAKKMDKELDKLEKKYKNQVETHFRGQTEETNSELLVFNDAIKIIRDNHLLVKQMPIQAKVKMAMEPLKAIGAEMGFMLAPEQYQKNPQLALRTLEEHKARLDKLDTKLDRLAQKQNKKEEDAAIKLAKQGKPPIEKIDLSGPTIQAAKDVVDQIRAQVKNKEAEIKVFVEGGKATVPDNIFVGGGFKRRMDVHKVMRESINQAGEMVYTEKYFAQGLNSFLTIPVKIGGKETLVLDHLKSRIGEKDGSKLQLIDNYKANLEALQRLSTQMAKLMSDANALILKGDAQGYADLALLLGEDSGLLDSYMSAIIDCAKQKDQMLSIFSQLKKSDQLQLNNAMAATKFPDSNVPAFADNFNSNVMAPAQRPGKIELFLREVSTKTPAVTSEKEREEGAWGVGDEVSGQLKAAYNNMISKMNELNSQL